MTKKSIITVLTLVITLGLTACDPANKTIKKVNHNFLDGYEGDVKKLKNNHKKAKKSSRRYRVKALEEELKKYEEKDNANGYTPEQLKEQRGYDNGKDMSYYNQSSYYPSQNYSSYQQQDTVFDNIVIPDEESRIQQDKGFIKPSNTNAQKSYDYMLTDSQKRAEQRKEVINLAKAQKAEKERQKALEEAKKEPTIGEKIEKIFN